MPIADEETYLREVVDELMKRWPDNRTVNIVCHGHSVPAGYFATPTVDTFNSYPHILHKKLKERYPYAVLNVIVTAIGGENAEQGANRFAEDVLCHKPDVVTIDYSLNDRRIGLDRAKEAWSRMIDGCIRANTKCVLLTPTADDSWNNAPDQWDALADHSRQVRALAAEYGVGLADSLATWLGNVNTLEDLARYLSQSNHPNMKGHELVAHQLLKWFQ